MDSRIMIIALLAILIVNGHPVPDGQSKSVVSGVFIPADTFKNLQAEANKNRGKANGLMSDRMQSTGQVSNQGLAMESNLKINPSSQNLQPQPTQQPMPSNQQSNQLQIIANRQPSQSSQQPVFINQQSQPMVITQQNPSILGNQQPNQQSVLVQSQPPVMFSQQPGQIVVQTPQQNQQQFYVAQTPHQIYVSQQPNQPIIIHQQPNQGQAMIFTQPGQQQGIIVTQQPNQQTMYVNEPSNQMLIKDGGAQQQIVVSQPSQRPTFFVSQPAQQGHTILVGGPNQAMTPSGQVGQAIVNVAQPAMTNGNQSVFVPKPNQNNVLYYSLNNQGVTNGNTILIPVQQ